MSLFCHIRLVCKTCCAVIEDSEALQEQNLFFAFVYNSLGVPIAAGILYPFFGLLLSPMIAATAMSSRSASVISNALILRSVKV